MGLYNTFLKLVPKIQIQSGREGGPGVTCQRSGAPDCSQMHFPVAVDLNFALLQGPLEWCQAGEPWGGMRGWGWGSGWGPAAIPAVQRQLLQFCLAYISVLESALNLFPIGSSRWAVGRWDLGLTAGITQSCKPCRLTVLWSRELSRLASV